jgi:hypothetical protein
MNEPGSAAGLLFKGLCVTGKQSRQRLQLEVAQILEKFSLLGCRSARRARK